ncbi:leucine-rich repeat domain-containing protein [Xylanibacter brevis]|uniref:leucine-rich repeat domain-containing protein n=1 Tax=Xylanibacter brevis TaxID=83231 RepID=UPI00265B1156|nr:leucine-rich repeat domain-containing protein [Xylanibacter brevis]
MNDAEFSKLYALFLLAHSQQELSAVSFRLFLLNKVEKPIEEVLSTEATEEDLKDAIEDEYGVKYSRDGKKLLEAPTSFCGKEYVVREGTEVICDEAFRDWYFLQSITIPNSVTSIGDYAFAQCEPLQSITIPNSVTSIGDGAFSWCTSLQSITIPNSVTSIGNGAFIGCNICFFICNSPYFQNDDVCLFNKDKTAIVSTIKDCVNYIIPNSVTKIGDGAFYCCDSLQSVTIPNSVTSIGKHAFNSCKSLQSITIPNSVTKIGNYAFYWCKSLQSITIPNSVTKIGVGAFDLCMHLDEPSRLRLKELNYTD